jgi:CarD family transcriptional regulator
LFQIGDKIVYPMHGAGVIEIIEEREILGEKQQYYVIKMPITNMQIMVPVEKASNVGIRPVVDMFTLEKLNHEMNRQR